MSKDFETYLVRNATRDLVMGNKHRSTDIVQLLISKIRRMGRSFRHFMKKDFAITKYTLPRISDTRLVVLLSLSQYLLLFVFFFIFWKKTTQLCMAGYWLPFCMEIFIFHCLICGINLKCDKQWVGTDLLVFPSRSALLHSSPCGLCVLLFVTRDAESECYYQWFVLCFSLLTSVILVIYPKCFLCWYCTLVFMSSYFFSSILLPPLCYFL